MAGNAYQTVAWLPWLQFDFAEGARPDGGGGCATPPITTSTAT